MQDRSHERITRLSVFRLPLLPNPGIALALHWPGSDAMFSLVLNAIIFTSEL
jgi:hypothetical protein